MDFIVRGVGAVSKACGVLAALLMIAACGVVCQMVFMRYVLNASTIWQTEFVLFSIVGATLVGSPYVLATRGHVGVDFVASRSEPGLRRALGVLAALIGIAFCVVLTWSGWRFFYEAWSQGWVTESVWAPPLGVVLLPLPVGMALLTVQYVVDLACLVTGYDTHRLSPDAARAAPGLLGSTAATLAVSSDAERELVTAEPEKRAEHGA